MSKVTGTCGYVTLPSGFNAFLTNWSFNENIDAIDITGFDDSGWKNFVEGCHSATGSAGGFVLYDEATSKPMTLTAGSYTGALVLQAETACTISGTALITSISMDRQNCAAMPITFNFQFQGVPTITWDETGA